MFLKYRLARKQSWIQTPVNNVRCMMKPFAWDSCSSSAMPISCIKASFVGESLHESSGSQHGLYDPCSQPPDQAYHAFIRFP